MSEAVASRALRVSYDHREKTEKRGEATRDKCSGERSEKGDATWLSSGNFGLMRLRLDTRQEVHSNTTTTTTSDILRPDDLYCRC